MDDVTRLPEEATSGTEVGATSVASERFEPGTIFAGRFRIIAPLGKGGMGEVYRADDLKLGQTVALKLLPADLAGHPGRLAQFHNEVRIARTISHRNVCRTYDIGDAHPSTGSGRAVPFLTMEYVDGEDLSSLLRRIGRLLIGWTRLLSGRVRTFAGEQLALELAISLGGIALVLGVLLRFGLLALVVTFYTFLTMEMFPLTVDLSRPYAGAAMIVILSIAAVAAYGFYASRGDEPLFGRAILDGVNGDGG